MAVTPIEDAEKLFRRAVDALSAGETPAALALLERALKQSDDPRWHSYLGYCIAKERGQVKRGIDLCQASLEIDADNPAHYLNLAKVHLVAKQKTEALTVLRQGMAKGGSDEIIALFGSLGTRKKPVLPFLHRDNVLNKYLGIILSRLHLR
jgi:predicted Zn-dependent protease